MKLHALEVKNFRSIFTDARNRTLRLDLADGMNVIVGPNNTGKSNILRAMALALDPAPEFERSRDLPGQLRNNAVPTITLELRRTQTRGPEDTLFRYAEEYERDTLGADASTFASEGRIRFQVQLRAGRTGSFSRLERIQVKGKGAISGDAELQDRVIRQLRNVVRFVYIESGTDIRSLLRGRFRDILHAVLGEHRKSELEGARALQNRFAHDLETELLAPLSARIAEGLGQIFSDIEEVELIPSMPSIDQMLEGVTIRLRDSVPTALAYKGTGVRGGVLVSLLRYLAEQSRRSIIFAIEEPEAFLHPAAQEDLRRDFQALAGRPDCTVLVTTHSPYLVPSDSESQVVAVTKDREGRTQLVDRASGTDTRAQVMSGLFRDTGLAAVLARAGEIPIDAQAILFVEGWTDLRYLELVVAATGKTELLEGIHIVPSGGTFRLVAEVVITRALTDRPIVVLLDSDPPGNEAFKLLCGSRFKMSKRDQLLTYAAAFGRGRGVEVEAEDLFPVPLLETFVEAHGAGSVLASEPWVCPHLKRRRWPLTAAAKPEFVGFLESRLEARHTSNWLRLLTEVNACIERQGATIP